MIDPSTAILEPAPDEAVRDRRIDWLGAVKELAKYFDEQVKPKVKATLVGKKAARAVGDFFESILVPGQPVASIDPAKFLRLYEQGKIKKADFVAALTVNKTAAAKVLSGKEIDAISLPGKPRDDSLTVTRRKGVEFDLVKAIKTMGEELAKEAPSA